MQNNPLHCLKPLGFDYRVLTRFTLTGAVYKRLMMLSEHHYDGKCKRASQQGGFLYGWGNSLLFANSEPGSDPKTPADYPDDWVVEITCTSDELGTAGKIGEGESYLRNGEELYALTSQFIGIIRAANDQYNRLTRLSDTALMNATEG